MSDDHPVVGRGTSATATGSMTGNIIISGSAPAGLATFSAVVEGAYVFNNNIFNFQNSASLSYEAIIGEVVRNGELFFDPRSIAGLFAVPMTFSFNVKPGDVIDMSFYFRSYATSAVGMVELDTSNTFKLTAIDLPPGLSFLSDKDGFLSEFGASAPPPPPPPVDTNPSAVPEPSTTTALGALVLGALAMLRQRNRRRSTAV